MGRPARPLGITVLASLFLYLSFGGTAILAVLLLSGAARHAWVLLVEEAVSVSPRLMAIAHLGPLPIFGLCLIACAVYALIGAGMWTLRRWAREILIGVSILCAILCLAARHFSSARQNSLSRQPPE